MAMLHTVYTSTHEHGRSPSKFLQRIIFKLPSILLFDYTYLLIVEMTHAALLYLHRRGQGSISLRWPKFMKTLSAVAPMKFSNAVLFPFLLNSILQSVLLLPSRSIEEIGGERSK